MDKDFFKYKNAEVHFVRFGHGTKLLIALHGFANKGEIFLTLKESLEKEYTVYCIDLPFHGLTNWPYVEYTREDISALFKMILEKEHKKRFDIMGFSLGGRIVQKMLFEWYEQIDRVFLIAPYGLDNNLNIIPQWGKSLLNRILQKPGWLIKLSKGLYKVGLLPKFYHNFANYHIHTEEKRNRLFKTWYSLYHFKLQPQKVKSFLKEKNVEVDLYFGAKDKIIPVSLGEKLSEGLPSVKLHVLDSSHLLINQELNNLLKK